MRIIVTVVAVALLLLAACTGNRIQPSEAGDVSDSIADTLSRDTVRPDTMELLIAETPMPVTADELFDDFLFNFAANPRLQMERIRFPLKVKGEEGDEVIARGDWQTEHFFMRQGYYTLLLDDERQVEQVKNTQVDRVIIEKIFLDQGRVRQFLFSRVGGLWEMMSINVTPLADNANADFLQFYEQFATDSAFQASSLNPIVEFSGPDPDNEDSLMEGIITDDTWPAFAPELPAHTIYNIVYGQPAASTEKKVFMVRGISNGQELMLTFKRKEGRWKLTKLST